MQETYSRGTGGNIELLGNINGWFLNAHGAYLHVGIQPERHVGVLENTMTTCKHAQTPEIREAMKRQRGQFRSERATSSEELARLCVLKGGKRRSFLSTPVQIGFKTHGGSLMRLLELFIPDVLSITQDIGTFHITYVIA